MSTHRPDFMHTPPAGLVFCEGCTIRLPGLPSDLALLREQGSNLRPAH